MSERMRYPGGGEEARCPYEDAAIAMFLDGEPRSEHTVGSLPEVDLHVHAESCPACKSAIETTRELDALLASETRTDIDDATANRMLSAVAERVSLAEPSSASVNDALATRRMAQYLVPIALAASLLLGLAWLAWGLGADDAVVPPIPHAPITAEGAADENEPDRSARGVEMPGSSLPGSPAAQRETQRETPREAKRETQPTRRETQRPAPGPAVARAAAPRGVRVPARWALVARPVEEPDRLPLLSVLADDEGARPHEVVVRLEACFAAAPRVADDDSVESRTLVAAIRWLASGVTSGVVAPRYARLPIAALLRSRGALRDRLVGAMRDERIWSAAIGRFRIRRSSMTARDLERVSLIGALGLADYSDALAGTSGRALDRCFREARRTGDRESMTFALHLFLAAAKRSAAATPRSAVWLGDLSCGAAFHLHAAIDRLVAAGCSPFMRDVCALLSEDPGSDDTSLMLCRDAHGP